MRTVVIGGQSRDVGKTSLACGIIAGLPQRDWTAVKITQFGHGICAADGNPCDCAVDDAEHPYALTLEQDPEGRSDTSRMLRAGAKRAIWLRVLQGRLEEAMPGLLERLEGSEAVVIESNSVIDYLDPDVYVPVMDASVADCKASIRRLLPRADAVALVNGKKDPRFVSADTPLFPIEPRGYCSPELVEFVERKLTEGC